jgi:hypothetical protein
MAPRARPNLRLVHVGPAFCGFDTGFVREPGVDREDPWPNVQVVQVWPELAGACVDPAS